jgi:hypothetical protein
MKFPLFLDNWLTDGGEVVSLKRQPCFTPPERYLVLIAVREIANGKQICTEGATSAVKGGTGVGLVFVGKRLCTIGIAFS